MVVGSSAFSLVFGGQSQGDTYLEPHERGQDGAEHEGEECVDGQLAKDFGEDVGGGVVEPLGALAPDDGALPREEVEGLDDGDHGGVDARVHQHGGALLDGVLLRACMCACMCICVLLGTCVLRCIHGMERCVVSGAASDRHTGPNKLFVQATLSPLCPQLPPLSLYFHVPSARACGRWSRTWPPAPRSSGRAARW